MCLHAIGALWVSVNLNNLMLFVRSSFVGILDRSFTPNSEDDDLVFI